MAKSVKVRYLGTKQIKRDTVTGTLAVWAGQNSVAEVPEETAMQLCQFPDVWQMADKKVVERPKVEKVEPEPAPVLQEVKPAKAKKADQVEEESQPPVTPGEIFEILGDLDKDTDFTDAGRPILGKIRERFEGRMVSTGAVRSAWQTYTAE